MTTTYIFCKGSGAYTPVISDKSAANEFHYAPQPCPECGKILIPQRDGTVRKHQPMRPVR